MLLNLAVPIHTLCVDSNRSFWRQDIQNKWNVFFTRVYKQMLIFPITFTLRDIPSVTLTSVRLYIIEHYLPATYLHKMRERPQNMLKRCGVRSKYQKIYSLTTTCEAILNWPSMPEKKNSPPQHTCKYVKHNISINMINIKWIWNKNNNWKRNLDAPPHEYKK